MVFIFKVSPQCKLSIISDLAALLLESLLKIWQKRQLDELSKGRRNIPFVVKVYKIYYLNIVPIMEHMNQKGNNMEYEIILELLSGQSHGREISRKLGIPPTTTLRLLKELESKSIIEPKISGKNKIYFLKKGLPSRTYVYNAENYKLIKIINKYPFLEPIIQDIRDKAKNHMIILFGSFARLKATKDSDIDIFIESKTGTIKKEVELINSRISVKTGSFNLESSLIREIVNNHAIIQGIEEYYEKMGFFS